VHLLSALTGVQLAHTHGLAALWWGWQEGVVTQSTKQSQARFGGDVIP